MPEKKRGQPQHGAEKKKTYSFVLMPSQFEELIRQADAKQMNRNEYLIYKLKLNK